jgi:hypothetical protein
LKPVPNILNGDSSFVNGSGSRGSSLFTVPSEVLLQDNDYFTWIGPPACDVAEVRLFLDNNSIHFLIVVVAVVLTQIYIYLYNPAVITDIAITISHGMYGMRLARMSVILEGVH